MGSAALSVNQLLPSGAGRVAAIYSDPARPSYDECIAKNMAALGPELVVNGDFSNGLTGWTDAGGNGSAAVSGGVLTITEGTSREERRQVLTVEANKTYLIRAKLGGSLPIMYFGSTAMAADYGNIQSSGPKLITSTTTELSVRAQTLNTLGGGASATFAEISVREIDLSKCVLFSDAAGQTPVVYPIAAGQGKGLLLDRSAGLVRGVELVVNGGFDSDPAAAWSGIDGVFNTWNASDKSITMRCIAGAGSNLVQDMGLSSVKAYRLTLTVSGSSSGSEWRVTNSSGAVFGVFGGNGAKSFIILSPNRSNLAIQRVVAVGDYQITIDNISVREIPGHHQQQPTAAARGEFSRRYNLLESTENFQSSYWSKLRCTATTATRIEASETNANGFNVNRSAPAIPQAAGIRTSLRLTRGSSDWMLVLVWDGSANGVRQWVNVATGALGTAAAIGTGVTQVGTPTLTAASGGGFDFSTETQMAGTAVGVVVYPAVSGDGAFGCTIGDYGFVDRADLRLSADAIPSIPAYQRVTTASDYDEVGFPTYHRAVTDDWAKSHMNPAGATKAYVFWAGQQLSGSAAQPIVESSSNPAASSGVFGLYSFGAGFNVRSKGTLDSISVVGGGGPAGVRSACVGRGDIPSDVATLTLNGTAYPNTADQGTGAYTEQDVYFGARAGTSLFANIREYAPPTILFLQPADSLSASHLSKLQRGYAKAVGVTL